MTDISNQSEENLAYSEIKVSPKQNQALNYMFYSITHDIAEMNDILMVVTYHQTVLEQTENINNKSKPYHKVRMWIINNLTRILEEKFIDPNASYAVQEMLSIVPWVISAIVKCHMILISNDEKYLRHFAVNLMKILKFDMHLQNLIKDNGTESNDLAELINVLREDETNDKDGLC